MFPASASGREAAKLAQQLGFVRLLTDETSGKQTARLWTISEAGLVHWHRQTDPARAVQALADAIAGCRHELAELGKRTQACQEYLSRLSCAVENAFSSSKDTAHPPIKASAVSSSRASPLTLPSPPEAGGEGKRVRHPETDGEGNRARSTWSGNGTIAAEAANAILECLRGWRDAGDCPLPVLFEKVRAACADMSLGAFHDALRTLRDRGAIHLHPWTGPLYELPDPTVALLAGHEIAYYASARESDPVAPLPPGEGWG